MATMSLSFMSTRVMSVITMKVVDTDTARSGNALTASRSSLSSSMVIEMLSMLVRTRPP